MAASRPVDVYDSLMLYITSEKYFIEPLNERGDIISIDRVSREIRLTGKSGQIPPIATSKPIFGIVGVITLIAGPYLIVITKREKIGEINGQSVWRIEEVELLSYARTFLHLTEEQVQYNKTYISMVQSVLNTPSFYFSTTYDLSHTLQRLHNTTPDFLQMGLMERADQRFVWNYHLLLDFTSEVELRRFCLPIIHGFLSVKPTVINDKPFTWTLISRRSCYRAGTRMFMRGLDTEGYAANFVETEQILEFGNARASFVQTRGSIPLFWTQLPDLRYKPPPQLTPNQDHLDGFQKHFNNQIFNYGKQVIINLIDHKGAEGAIERTLSQTVASANNNNIRYEAFDFHKECKKMRYDRLSILIDNVSRDQDNFGYFLMLEDGSVPMLQDGVFRTNCIDCLDRTNVVQSLLAKQSLQQKLLRLNILRPGQSTDSHDEFSSLYKNVWADNGDACSIQYAGTGALKSDFTRTGKRTPVGAMRDGYNSCIRYIKNNFYDGFRQDAIDLFLGNYRVHEDEGVARPCPLTVKKDVKYLALPIFLLIAIACCFMTMLIPSVYTTEVYMFFLFWTTMVACTVMVIFFYGAEFVDFPKLRDLRPRRRVE